MGKLKSFGTKIYAPIGRAIHGTVRKNKNILFWFKIARRWPDAFFRQYVANYLDPKYLPGVSSTVWNKNPHKVRNIQIHELGDKNAGKVIMLMNNRLGHGGFCGLWIYYLNRLAFSDKMGFYHVMNCVQSDFYQEDHPINGTRNVFEYYFQQPCGISLKSAWKSQMVVFDYNCDDYGYNDAFHVGGEIDYTFKNDDIKQFAELQKKYIRLQPNIEKRIRKQINTLLGDSKVLAVHARGTDYKIAYKGHPLPITPEDYLESAIIKAKEIGAEKIFLATDDSSIVKIFKNRLGDKVVYYTDVIRSEGTVWNCYVESKQRNPHFRLGYEIVRDVYTMAACSGFVCGMSYVSYMVQVVKLAQDENFETFVRLFHGLRKDGMDLTDDGVRAEVRKRWAIELGIEQKREQAIADGLDPDEVAPLPDWEEEGTIEDTKVKKKRKNIKETSYEKSSIN